MKSSDQLPRSVLSDSSFLTERSNAAALRRIDVEATAAADTRKYLVIAGIVALGAFAAFALWKK